MAVPQEAVVWRKSRQSQDEGACVELAFAGLIRDSKNPDGPVLRLPIRDLVAVAKSQPDS